LNRGDALWKRIDKGALKDFVSILGSVPVTGETLRKHRKNKPVFGHITRYRDTTQPFERFKMVVQQVYFSHAWPQRAPTVWLRSTARRVPQNT
jgi:hypothetical protein